MKTLWIEASPKGDDALSSQLALAYLDTADPVGEVERLSVWDDDVLHDVLYSLGTYERGVFSPRTWGRLSFGPSLYAATAFRDKQDRTCVMFWPMKCTAPSSGCSAPEI